MSTTAAALTVAGVLAVSLTAACWHIHRAQRSDATRDRIIRAARARVGLPPAAPDNTPGLNAAWQDECELIWATPLHDPAGFDRLRQAIRDHREEEEA